MGRGRQKAIPLTEVGKNLFLELPDHVQQLQNQMLANTLQMKTQLTSQEWDSFKLAEMQKNHYVQVGLACYQLVFRFFRQLIADGCTS